MTRHARKPAILTLILAIGGSAALLAATGQFRFHETTPRSLQEFETIIASGETDAATWQAYGDALCSNKRYAHAAAAYQRSLDLEPDRAQARFNAALALAQANQADKFFDFFNRIIAYNPKQAVDLLERPELASMHSDPRWTPTATLAQGQAAD
ncbi:MAG: hypothetical protein FWD61_15005 [Phycisphaerales bacterium]|nr:hypothetical protein [Phycisphaerales bacterium]